MSPASIMNDELESELSVYDTVMGQAMFSVRSPVGLDIYDTGLPEVVTAAVLLAALEDADAARRARKFLGHRYLCRPQLLPHPRFDTPWQALYHSRSDRAFITTMGLDVETFHRVLESGFQPLWDTHPVTRNDVSRAGAPRLGARSLDAAGALGLYLHWITSTMPETSLQQVFALIPATVRRYLALAMVTLLITAEAHVGPSQQLVETPLA